MSTARRARIADQIQRELADLIRLEVRDPRVGLVTVTGVELSRDQSHAKVFITALGSASEASGALEGLRRAAGFLRTSLAHRLTTRTVPELSFSYDESIERGIRLTRLIDEAVSPKPAAKPPRARRAPRK